MPIPRLPRSAGNAPGSSRCRVASRSPSVLHVFNGSVTASKFRDAGGRGDLLVWRESLIAGWTPAVHRVRSWVAARARQLAVTYGLDVARLARAMRRQERSLAQARRYDEVVIWVGRDLPCQLLLLYLLPRLAQVAPDTRVSLVCPPTSGKPGMPCVANVEQRDLLGELSRRRELTPVERRVAAKAWRAYSSAEPRDLDRAIRAPMAAVLETDRTLSMHRERFPSVQNGLGRIEQRLLEQIAGGVRLEEQLVDDLGERESGYGWSAAQVGFELSRLASGPRPAIKRVGSRLAVTVDGLRMLAGSADCIALNGIDIGLGGARLAADRHWRWDASAGRLVAYG